MTARRFIRLLPGLAALGLAACAPSYQLVSHTPDEQLRHETFQFRKWARPDSQPDVVVIGIHGFCGASIDYENLGRHLVRTQPRSALYAYEVRGQGRDPLKDRRGDIDDPENWSRDLHAFTDLVRQRHPDARIVWFGESMGGLILARTYRADLEAGRTPPCDALAISSPVVKFRDDFPTWKKQLVRGIAAIAPNARVSLDALSGGAPVQMTHDSIHSDQAQTNSWHIETHTLRLLSSLGTMIDEMPENAATFQVPTLILHGGQDFFSNPADVQDFTGRIPRETPRTRRFYRQGHHLLMYDDIRDNVIADIADWLDELRRRQP